MTAVIGPVLCSCSWRGDLATRGSCPGCGADYTYRVTPRRLAKLRAIAARQPGDPPVWIEPQMRQWLSDPRHRMIDPDAPPNPAVEDRVIRRPMRGFVLSEAGQRVLAAELEAEQRRHHVAAAAARHADAPE